MANTQSTQAFYSLTLEAGSAPTAACLCNVIPGLKATDQQIFEARGERVYLRRVIKHEDGGASVETVLEHDVFSIVRAVGAFKIPGTKEGKSIPSYPEKQYSDQVFTLSETLYLLLARLV
jgi:splicing factor 3B subunit 3